MLSNNQRAGRCFECGVGGVGGGGRTQGGCTRQSARQFYVGHPPASQQSARGGGGGGAGGGTNQVSAPAPRAQLVDSSAVVCRQGRGPDAPYPALAYTSAATPLCLHITVHSV